MQERVDALRDQFQKRCVQNPALEVKNPKCFQFLNQKLSSIKIDSAGVKAIEYYRFSSSLRKILTLETWSEMYDVCTANLNK